VEQRAIREIDINPLASADNLIALDARVVLQPAEMREEKLPKLAIRPYPSQYVRTFTMKEGTPVTIRPIRPEDEPMMVRFHGTLSDDTVHSRYFHLINLGQRVQHDRLARVCFIDYDRETALVAERAAGGERSILGVGRLTRVRASAAAEFAILVIDKWQRHGLGSELLRRLIEVARAEGIEQVSGFILPENHAMEKICRELGFTSSFDLSEGVLRATLNVRETPPASYPARRAASAAECGHVAHHSQGEHKQRAKSIKESFSYVRLCQVFGSLVSSHGQRSLPA
jgi:acetyltransferase